MNEWLYPDTSFSENKAQSSPIIAPQNGHTGLQIQLCGINAGENVKIDTVHSGGRFTVELYRQIKVRVTDNTGPEGFTTADWETVKEYSIRQAPFFVYDPLLPLTDGEFTSEGESDAVYVSIFAESDAIPGKYILNIIVSAGTQKEIIPVEFEIADVSLHGITLKTTNQYSIRNMAHSHGIECWSDEHFKMIEKYGKLMRRAHQNVFFVTWDLVDIQTADDGMYLFDFTRCKRFIELYLSLGFTVIEGAQLFFLEESENGGFMVSLVGKKIDALSPDGISYTAAFLTAWRKFLKENDWYNLLIQHVGDEPHIWVAEKYQILTGIVRKYLPGVPLIDAVETHELYGALDIWVPKNNYFEENMEKLRKSGDVVWFYTCCIPGGKYCNRFLDAPLLRTRMLHFGNYRYNIPGYLHWGLNLFEDNQNPYTDLCPYNSPTTKLPAGDTHIVYPHDNDVLGSMRLEMMMSGIEDYELLRMLSEKNKPLADEICASVFRAFNDCDNTAEDFDTARCRLIHALEEKTTPERASRN